MPYQFGCVATGDALTFATTVTVKGAGIIERIEEAGRGEDSDVSVRSIMWLAAHSNVPSWICSLRFTAMNRPCTLSVCLNLAMIDIISRDSGFRNSFAPRHAALYIFSTASLCEVRTYTII